MFFKTRFSPPPFSFKSAASAHPKYSFLVRLQSYPGDRLFAHRDDYLFFSFSLSKLTKNHQAQLHAYAFVPNQVLLLISVQNKRTLNHLVTQLTRQFGQFSDRRYEQGHRPPRGTYQEFNFCDSEKILETYQSVEALPLQTGRTEDLSEYSWTSYSFNVGGEMDDLITPHPAYRALGSTRVLRRLNYARLFENERSLADHAEPTQRSEPMPSYYKPILAFSAG